ncbi:MAG: pilus assembly protein [Planctomycetota bacterium]|nr:pilus assembly protein [Planctomycetota bacterium]
MRKSTVSRSRTGAAAVELAVCLPVLVLLVMAMIEAANMIYLKQALVSAAHVSVRALVEKDAVGADAQQACGDFLDARNIREYTLTIAPEDFDKMPRGAAIVGTVTAPCTANSYAPNWFFGGRMMRVQATMAREAGQVGTRTVSTRPGRRGAGKPTDRGNRDVGAPH